MLATKILKCANITLILNSLVLLLLLNEVVANLSPWDGIERLMFRVWSTSPMASSKVTYLWCYQSEPGPLQILIIPLKNNRQISFSVRQTPNISEKNMKPFVAFFFFFKSFHCFFFFFVFISINKYFPTFNIRHLNPIRSQSFAIFLLFLHSLSLVAFSLSFPACPSYYPLFSLSFLFCFSSSSSFPTYVLYLFLSLLSLSHTYTNTHTHYYHSVFVFVFFLLISYYFVLFLLYFHFLFDRLILNHKC